MFFIAWWDKAIWSCLKELLSRIGAVYIQHKKPTQAQAIFRYVLSRLQRRFEGIMDIVGCLFVAVTLCVKPLYAMTRNSPLYRNQ